MGLPKLSGIVSLPTRPRLDPVGLGDVFRLSGQRRRDDTAPNRRPGYLSVLVVGETSLETGGCSVVPSFGLQAPLQLVGSKELPFSRMGHKLDVDSFIAQPLGTTAVCKHALQMHDTTEKQSKDAPSQPNYRNLTAG